MNIIFYEGQIIFTYFHLASDKALTKALLDAKVTAIAYETIQLEDNSLPLLRPMSEAAGRLAVANAMYFMFKTTDGSGLLMNCTPGTERAKVTVIGGSVETITKETTHDNPTFIMHDVIHYSVANMPGAVTRTSTIALTNATIQYALAIANTDFKTLCKTHPLIRKGIQTVEGKLVFAPVEEAHNLEYVDVLSIC